MSPLDARFALLLAPLSLSLAGCFGESNVVVPGKGGGSSDGQMPAGPSDYWSQGDTGSSAAPLADCQPNEVSPGRAPLRRLTHRELDNTLRDVLGDTSAPGKGLPPEDSIHGFHNNSTVNGVTPALARAYFQAAFQVVDALSLSALLPCSEAAGDNACRDTFLLGVGKKLYRRALDDDERADLTKLFEAGRQAAGFGAGARWALKAMIQAAPFLYRLELDDGTLTQAELATRLSYLLWSSAPDEALVAAAERGELASPAQLEAQARRMVEDPRARAMVQDFHAQWLGLDRLDVLEKDPALFPTFAAVKPSMKRETEAFLGAVFWDEKQLGRYLDAPFSYVDDALAGHYGLPKGQGTQLTRVTSPAGRRGLLTQASMLSLMAKSDESHPVIRGKFVREQLLCQELVQPPGELEITVPPPNDALTTRERFSAHSQNPRCSGCHRLTDGIGMGMEDFDGIGASRTTQNGKPIDSSGQLVGTDVDGEFKGAAELSQKLAGSALLRRCVATQWFRFGAGRDPHPQEDKCNLSRLQRRLEQPTVPLPEVLVALTQLDGFVRRGAAPEAVGGSGDPSPPAPAQPQPEAAPGTGLKSEYFDNVDFTGTRVLRLDSQVSFEWGKDAPVDGIAADTFSARWTGELSIPSDGSYTLVTWSDDGVRLWLDGQLIIDHWSNHGVARDAVTRTLSKGRHAIKLEYFDSLSDAVVKLHWAPPGATEQAIPASFLYPAP